MFQDLVDSRQSWARRNGLALPASAVFHATLGAAALAAVAFTPAVQPVVAANLQPPVLVLRPAAPSRIPPDPPPNRGGGSVQTRRATAPQAPLLPVSLLPAGSPQATGDDTPNATLACADCGSIIGIPGLGEGGPAGGAPEGQPVRAGVHVAPPRKLHHVPPQYPEIARRARVQGSVVIECRIDERGHVVEANVEIGHPLLDAAALEAVRQWLYVPSLLNGVQVAVLMTVTVNFRLDPRGM
jgi:protein TonB